ncbi:MAG: oligoendopeptidase F [Firmicutes bacterium]|nr:oligoendopeptidase F [Bacillota bacterium]
MEIKAKKRSEISADYKWKLEDMYQTEADWRQDMDVIAAKLEEIAGYQGKLITGEALEACLDKFFTAGQIMGKVYVYANMKMHEDANVSASQGLADTAQNMYVKFSAATAFITPEILSHEENIIRGFVANTPGLKMYEHYLEDIIRGKAHVLSSEIEEILANSGELGNAPSNIFSMLSNADLKFGTITDENGNTVEITRGRYGGLIESQDRRVRKDAFETYYASYEKLKNTFAAMFNASVKKDVFFARTRKYGSALDAALSANNIPRAVYEQLIETVNEFLPVMHRYIALRKKALKLDELHQYDLYAPLAEKADTKVTYEDAKKKLVESLEILGADYLEAMAKGMESGWIDVYENEGKRSGAYSWGAPGNHPYVLMNYDDKLNDMFTLAHEMGHAMHSYYSWDTQPNVYARYTIFLAEVASTVNETLLMDYMLETTTDPKVRTYLLSEYLDQFVGTVFRQTMFAEFELITHDMVENDKPLTLAALNKVFRELTAKYSGPDVVLDEQIELGWARIPHFYTAFYVYQYATGYSAAIALKKRLQTGNPQALEDYLDFLKAGSSDYSIEILKKAGVDMSTPTPVREALMMFEELVEKMEKVFE